MQVTAEYPVNITNPEKLMWPELNIRKSDYIQYVISVSNELRHHIEHKLLTMIRFPNGIKGHKFYQKNRPVGTPEWVKTVPVYSPDRKDVIHYVVVDSLATLIWVANLGALELHVGFSDYRSPEYPQHIAFDLDPSVPGFEPVREIAITLHQFLDSLELPHIAKTSGATGLQIFVPIQTGHTYDDTRVFTKAIADYLLYKLPNIVTLERLTRNRGTKVYVDYLQHGHNRTLIAPYSARATPQATVSAPLTWQELDGGALPEHFTVLNMARRIRELGDLMNVGPPTQVKHIVQFLQTHSSF